VASLSRFILVFVPGAAGNDEARSYRRRLTVDKSQFFLDRLNAPEEHGVSLLHPTHASHYTYPFWIREDAGGDRVLLVGAKENRGKFEGPKGDEPIAFFREPPGAHVFLQDDRGGASYLYERFRADTWSLPDSIVLSGGTSGESDAQRHDWQGCLGHLLRGRKDRDRSTLRGPVDRWSIAQAADDDGTVDGPIAGWLNPLVLAFDVDGDALRPPEPGEDLGITHTRTAVASALDNAAVLAVIPVLDEEWDGRLVGWEHLLRSRTAGEGLNVFERLVVGGTPEAVARQTPEPALLPFQSLDAMGGRFAIEAADSPDPSFRWLAPELGANGRWLARWMAGGWQRGWRGFAPELETSPGRSWDFGLVDGGGQDVDREVIVAERGPLSRARGESTACDLDEEEAARAVASAADMLELCAPALRESRLQLVSDYVIDLIADSRLGGHRIQQAHRGFVRVDDHGRRRQVDVDFTSFFREVANRTLAPRSPILVAVPDPASGDAGPARPRYIDMRRSVDHGPYALLWGTLRPRADEPASGGVAPMDERFAGRRIELPGSFGWWNDWYQTLFVCPAEARVKFGFGGFVTGAAQVGLGILGRDGGPAAAVERMRFILPS